MNICTNMVLEVESKSESNRIRIIWIESENDRLYYVPISTNRAMPKTKKISELEEMIENGVALIIKDPFAKLIDENDLSEREKYLRDKNYEIIKGIWEDKEILDKNKRNLLINDFALKNNMSVSSLERLLFRYWSRGLTKNALLQDYNKSGGRGKDKACGTTKRGKPRNDINGVSVQGINIDETIKTIFKKAYEKYYQKKQQKSIAETYSLMLIDYFSDQIKENEMTRYKVWDNERIPTYGQFYYWVTKNRDTTEDFISRESDKKFQSEKRELLHNSNEKVFGPGSKYQVDATVADVFLVSEIYPDKIIGRPIIYIVIDVFSRLVVGMYIGLEGPSWIGAMMALDNVVEDKLEYCSQYGVDTTCEYWPTSYLPEGIVADRGEFEGYNVTNLINNLNIQIENTPPYRGDLKGIVERKFKTINTKIKHTTPGAIAKQYRERGDKPYYLDAKLNLKQFAKEIIFLIIDHNKSIIQKYERDREMIKAGLLAVPYQLWQWGIQNRRTGFVNRDRDIVRLNLLPQEKAVITREGIRFKKRLFYTCSKAIEEQWFVKRINISVGVVYDPRSMNYIYIINKTGDGFIKCRLMDKCNQYSNLSLNEIVFIREVEAEQNSEYKKIETQQKVDLENNFKQITDEAKKNNITSSVSDNKKRQSIKENRKFEKEDNRIRESFELEQIGISKQQSDTEVDGENYEPVSKLHMLRRIRDERK